MVKSRTALCWSGLFVDEAWRCDVEDIVLDVAN
jgi:hypothetical protein